MKKKILYIQPFFDPDYPRNIRTANMIKYLSNDFDIEVICLKHHSLAREIHNTSILRIEPGFLSKYVFLKNISGFRGKGLSSFLSKGGNYLGSKLIFPDPYKLEHNQIIKAVLDSQKYGQIAFIIFSIVPHSSYQLAQKLRKVLDQQVKFIFDIGDPLFNNSAAHHTLLKSYKTKRYEQRGLEQADGIILTNLQTKNMYRENKLVGTNLPVAIIPQGCDIALFNEQDEEEINLHFPEIKMIYAGMLYPRLRNPLPLFGAIKSFDSPKVQLDLYGATNSFNINNPHIQFNNRIPQKALIEKYKSANVLVHFDNAFGVQSSGKIFELLSLKKPILFIYENDKSIPKKEFEHINTLFFTKNEQGAIKNTLDKMLSMNENRKINYSNKQYSWKNRSDQLKVFINSLN